MGYYFKHIMLSIPMIIWIIAFIFSAISCIIEFCKQYKNQNKIKHWIFIVAFIVVVGLPVGLGTGYSCVNNHAKAVGTKKLDNCYGSYHRGNFINNEAVEGLPKYINVTHNEIDGFNKHHKQIFEYDIVYHTYNPNRGCVVLHGNYMQGGKWLRHELPRETHYEGGFAYGDITHNRGNGTILIGRKGNQLLINLNGDYDDDINSHSLNHGKPCRLTSGIDSDDTVGFVHGSNQNDNKDNVPSLF